MTTKAKRLLLRTLRHVESEIRGADISGAASPPKSRVGKKMISGHFDPAVSWQLKKLAVDRDASVQGLMEEAILDLFAKYHLPMPTGR